jgi:hypothetical protein
VSTDPAGGAPPPGPQTPATRRVWGPSLLPLAIGIIIAVTGSLGARYLNPLPDSLLGAPARTLVYLTLLAAAGALLHRRRLWTAPLSAPPPAPAPPAAAPTPHEAPAAPAPAADATADTLLDRVRTVLQERHPDIVVAAGSVTFDDDGNVNAFSLKTLTPSGFSDPAIREKVFVRVSESIEGRWNMTADPRRDMLHLRTKLPFPGAVAPPLPTQIARSAEDALTLYQTDLALRLGVDENGSSLDVQIAKFPHWLFIGGTGSGKSVFMRGAVIEPFRAAGAMILIGDGKGTDYTPLIGLPNIVAVSQSTADHLRLVRLAADELRARRHDARSLQFSQAGTNPFKRPPMIVLLDEFATMINNIKGDENYGKDGLIKFIADLKFLLRVGREFKVHVGIASQEAYREIIDGQMMGNLSLRVSLGPPEDKTIAEVFPAKLQAEARRIGAGINKERDVGRALAFMASDDTDVVVEFQSYFGYTPNASKPPPSIIAADHERYRVQVSDQIPKLYPRLWWKMDGPEYATDLDILYDTPAVVLDDSDGNPDPQFFPYDPLHPSYLGTDRDGEGTPIPSLTELQQGVVYAPPAPAAPTHPVVDDLDDWGAPPASTAPPAPAWSGDINTFDSPGPPPEWAREPSPTPPPTPELPTPDSAPAPPATNPAAPSEDTDPDGEIIDPPWDTTGEPPIVRRRPPRVPPPPPQRPNTGAVNI